MRGIGSRRSRRNRLRAAAWPAVAAALGAAALLSWLAAPVGATASSPASASVSPADAAATSTYLTDVSGFGQMLLANAPKSVEALDGLASQLGSECPGVLSGAPTTSTFSQLSSSGSTTLSEILDTERQAGDLRAELTSAMSSSYLKPDAGAMMLLIASLNTLQWSNPALTAAVHAKAAAEQEALEAPTLNVCADMRAWVAAGYKTLPPGTAEFLARREAKRARAGSDDTPASIETLLASYESAGEKALAALAKALEGEFVTDAARTLTGAEAGIETALGIHSALSEAREASEHATIIAHVRTAAGGLYVAKAERPTSGAGGCKLRVSTERLTRKPGLLDSFAFSGAGDCLSGTFTGPDPSVNCNRGLLTITALAPASARAARLLLSDGRELTSRLIRAPKLGGRRGYYFQIVRGPTPIAKSLTELSADGGALRVVKLPRVVECTKHPIKYLPGGRPRVLARGRAPHGPSFTIVGERYSLLGHVHSELKVDAAQTPGEHEVSVGGAISFGSAPPPPFSIAESTGCNPKLYDIVYGVLKAPGARVLVRIAGVLRPLREARIPASLQAGPTLAFGAFTAAPTQVVVRNAHGKAISRESLRNSASVNAEQCEAEAE
jgi:hypothetical protein